ncbi:hypothetical protein [Halalkalibacter urbisdiaboli]|uniref:hypothetical protein n=1 Tax=Halalkalibacter urbisdiaboli TaxID=1960589 RepID=UPI000B4340DF|nr:hypothetical protein [Halalkalibacter urbisdiaboli]
MKSRKTITTIAIGMLFITVLMNLFNNDVWDVNEEMLKEEVISIEQSVETVNLLDVTPFEWDMVYSFDPYTSKEKVYETVGYKWDTISETVSEGMNQIVFMKDEKVVCYLFGYPQNNRYGIYFSGEGFNHVAQRINSNDDLTFQVKKSGDFVYLINY